MKKVPSAKSKRVCVNGHVYFKSSDCPVCPVCEELKKPATGIFSKLGAPARRALENNGVATLNQLSRFSESEILKFHGLGKSTIPILRDSLKAAGLHFKEERTAVLKKKS